MRRLALLAPAGGQLRACDGGVAIETAGDVLRAPCGGVVMPGASAPAGLGLRHSSGLEVHLGIGAGPGNGGNGCEWLVVESQQVGAGDELLRIDAGCLAQGARGATAWLRITAGGRVAWRSAPGPVEAGEVIMEVDAGDAQDATRPVPKSATRGDAPG